MVRIIPGLKSSRQYCLILVWILCSLGALPFATSAEIPTIERIPAPAWVVPSPVDLSGAAPKGEGTSASYFLLFDQQVHAGEETRYWHFATKILSESGVQDEGRITLGFDPAYETLTLHKLIVHRDGKAVDRLQQQDLKMLQREQGLDRHLYDGRLSAVMLLEDIRVGDTIEYAYSIRGANPIFNGLFMDAFSQRWSVPIHKYRYRLLWPENRKLTFKARGGELEPTIIRDGAITTYTWERSDTPAVIADGDLPSWFHPYGAVQLSEFQSWRDVAQWATRLYVVSDELPEELQKQIESISANTDKKVQAVAALRFVQNNIRYLGMQVGVHGYKPYPLKTVWQRRFGDCKDKALILCAMLRQLGMESYPALVETDYRHTIAEWLPSPYAFDHLVVTLRLDGRDYWLDPTMSHQGGALDQLYFPNYGKALVISDGTMALTDVTPGGFEATGIAINSTFDTGRVGGEVRMTARTEFRGMEADRTRRWLTNTSSAEIEKNYLNYYAKQYPGIRVLTAPQFVDDLEKNQIVSEESYTISNFWQPQHGKEGKLFGEFSPAMLSDRIEDPRSPVRSMPLGLAYPRKVTETIDVVFPHARDLTEDTMGVKDPAFTYGYKRLRHARGIQLTYHYETAVDSIEASRAGEYSANVRKVWEQMDYSIEIPKSMIEEGLSLASATDRPNAAAPSAMTKGFMLAPFLVFAGIVVVWAVQRFRPATTAGVPKEEPLHYCHRCGITEQTAPEMEFRVTADGLEYCRLHLPGETANRARVGLRRER